MSATVTSATRRVWRYSGVSKFGSMLLTLGFVAVVTISIPVGLIVVVAIYIPFSLLWDDTLVLKRKQPIPHWFQS